MNPSIQRLVHLTRQLSESLVTAAYCADEIRAVVDVAQQRAPDGLSDFVELNATKSPQRPLLDQSTFSVTWQGKSLHLGHTRSFWLLLRLARRPNQYVTHLDLLNDVWDDEELATATIRSTICQLRKRLCRSGMRRLAKAIQGHNGHYMLCV